MRDMKAAIYTYFLQCRYLHIPHVSPKKDFYCLKHGLVFQKDTSSLHHWIFKKAKQKKNCRNGNRLMCFCLG